eukprot:10847599-Prorocentrum_lima.AAC.1
MASPMHLVPNGKGRQLFFIILLELVLALACLTSRPDLRPHGPDEERQWALSSKEPDFLLQH